MALQVRALIVPGHDESHATSAARYLEECLPKSEYWDAPIDKIDWDARAVRLLIEAVCESSGLSLPFHGDDEKTPAADWPLPF